MYKFLFVLIMLISGLYIYYKSSHPLEYEICKPYCDVTVDRVIDGDTFVTTSNMRIRIAGYNAPELHDPMGPQAKHCLESLIDGKTITIKMHGRDYWNRQLATIVGRRITC